MGVYHNSSSPHDPEQNGVVERANRTLKDGVRVLLNRSGLPYAAWVCALHHVVLTKNRVFTTVGEKKWVPFTKWYGYPPNVDMFRAFGCMAVFQVPKMKRDNLEPQGKWGVHLGISHKHKGWLIWDISTQRMTVSRDVKFLEGLYYKDWKAQKGSLPSTPLVVERSEVQERPRQVQFDLSDNEESEVTEEEGVSEEDVEPEEHAPPHVPDAPPPAPSKRAPPASVRPKRTAITPTRLNYVGRGKTGVVVSWWTHQGSQGEGGCLLFWGHRG